MSRLSLALAALSLCALACLGGCASLHPDLSPETPPEATTETKTAEEIPGKPVITFEPASTPAGSLAEQQGSNVRANQDSSGRDQNETTIAINPTNTSNIIGGANDARLGSWAAGYYISHDGGQTFSDGTMPFTKYANQGDPVVAFCGDGTALFAYLDYIAAWQPHRLIVSRSTDGGDTWLAPGTVYEGSIPFADKPWLACAPDGGSFANRAYISWTHFSGGGVIRSAWSSDHGVTWQGAKNLSGAGVQGSVPAAGRNGLAYVFWHAGGSIQFAKSTNGGGSWSSATSAASITSIGDTDFRRNSFPTVGLDISGGSYDGHVYVAWSDQRNGDPDILFTRSTDGGTTWADPIRVNDDSLGNGRDQFFPWMAVDDHGIIHLMWHDRRGDSNNKKMHIYIASSRDGGVSFDRNLRVTDLDSDGASTGFLGDYAAIAAQGGKIVPLWSDLRAGSGEEDVYIEVEEAFDYDIVSGLSFAEDKQTVSFEDQEPRLGNAIVYDLILGDVGELSSASPWANTVCWSEDLNAPPAVVTELPDPGQALYVIIRAQGPRGNGSFGSGSSHPDPRDGLDAAPPCS